MNVRWIRDTATGRTLVGILAAISLVLSMSACNGNLTNHSYLIVPAGTPYTEDGKRGLLATPEGNQGLANIALTLLWDDPKESSPDRHQTTFDYTASAQSGDTATPGVDFVATTGHATMPADKKTKTFHFPLIKGDTADEEPETFSLVISNIQPDTNISPKNFTVRIENDELRLTSNSPEVTEGNTGTTDAVFNLTLSSQRNVPVDVAFETEAQGGTRAGGDFEYQKSVLTFPPGSTHATVTVKVIGDTNDEGDESFGLTLKPLRGAASVPAQPQAVIRDDDAAFDRPVVSISNVDPTPVPEGDGGEGTSASVTFTLSHAQGNHFVYVRYQVTAGPGPASASAGDVEMAVDTAQFFGLAETTTTAEVWIAGDDLKEPDETFSVKILSAENATIDPNAAVAQGVIADDDELLALDDSEDCEGSAGDSPLDFTVSLSAPLPHDVSFRYRTALATGAGAANAQDFVQITDQTASIATIPAGDDFVDVPVTIHGDSTVEPDETFRVQLFDSTGASIDPDFMDATGTILNDDGSTPNPGCAGGGTAGSLIAFARNGDIFTVDPNAADRPGSAAQLTNNADFEGNPAWSDDGSTIAYFRVASGPADVWEMDSDGADQHKLIDLPASDEFDPQYSPDGTRLLFTSPSDGDSEIYVADLTQNPPTITQVTHNTFGDSSAEWSPDGSKIIFSSDRNGNLDLFTINPNGTGETPVGFNSSANEDNPSYSPDGSRIAFNSDFHGDMDVFVIAADATDLGDGLHLTTDSAPDTAPTWSPDGSLVAFVSGRTGNADLYMTSSADENAAETQLTSGADIDTDPDWSPVGLV